MIRKADWILPFIIQREEQQHSSVLCKKYNKIKCQKQDPMIIINIVPYVDIICRVDARYMFLLQIEVHFIRSLSLILLLGSGWHFPFLFVSIYKIVNNIKTSFRAGVLCSYNHLNMLVQYCSTVANGHKPIREYSIIVCSSRTI